MTELDPVITRSKLAVTPAVVAAAADRAERSSETEADRRQPAEQRPQVHPHRWYRRCRRVFGRGPYRDDYGQRYGHRHCTGKSREDLRGLPSGRRFPVAAVRRNRPRTGDLPPAGERAGRPHRAAEHAGEGVDVHPDVPADTSNDRTECTVDPRRRRLSGRPRDVRGIPAVFRISRRRGAQRQRGAPAGLRPQAGPDPDGPVAAGHGRVGGDAAAQGRRLRPCTSRSSR